MLNLLLWIVVCYSIFITALFVLVHYIKRNHSDLYGQQTTEQEQVNEGVEEVETTEETKDEIQGPEFDDRVLSYKVMSSDSIGPKRYKRYRTCYNKEAHDGDVFKYSMMLDACPVCHQDFCGYESAVISVDGIEVTVKPDMEMIYTPIRGRKLSLNWVGKEIAVMKKKTEPMM